MRYKLAINTNTDDIVLRHAFAPGSTAGGDGIAIDAAKDAIKGKINVNHNGWFVPPHTPNLAQDAVLSNQIISRIRTELFYI